ncbi:MAG: beta-ketoacyl-ACP synthase 3 [Thermoguttaceae bacterium]|jgi:3-oxoacyl-[acyl-carrier-protein] synthase-3|nr:beta-ketoacyl-ACP synthase 3 [Thermoguttaceae bacterium]
MQDESFRLSLFLPAQGAAETEVTIIEWNVAEGDRFTAGQPLAQVDSAKSVFDFEAPCAGKVIRLLHLEGETLPLNEPVMEIETSDPAMRDWIPPAPAAADGDHPWPAPARQATIPAGGVDEVFLRGFGGYLPEHVVTNEELARQFPNISADYVFQVTGIRERCWAAEDEKPSDMAYAASLEAIRRSGIDAKDIDGIILATTTPDVAMPSTACILQDRLSLRGIPAFDLNAACSGWLYAVSMAQGMIRCGLARHVLTVGVDMQSRLLDPDDQSAYFIFGDGAGATVVSATGPGHRVCDILLGSDTRGLRMARREEPGYIVLNGQCSADPWIRLEGPSLFRLATESFYCLIRDSLRRAGWKSDDPRWIIPHQANGRILKAAAKRSGLPFERFFLNIDHVGNTSSASIPLALTELEDGLQRGDKLLLCSVGAGMTTAAVAVEW